VKVLVERLKENEVPWYAKIEDGLEKVPNPTFWFARGTAMAGAWLRDTTSVAASFVDPVESVATRLIGMATTWPGAMVDSDGVPDISRVPLFMLSQLGAPSRV
jgi:hypothetical protein